MTYTFANGFVAGIAYIDTSIDSADTNGFGASTTKNLYGATGVFSLSKTF